MGRSRCQPGRLLRSRTRRDESGHTTWVPCCPVLRLGPILSYRRGRRSCCRRVRRTRWKLTFHRLRSSRWGLCGEWDLRWVRRNRSGYSYRGVRRLSVFRLPPSAVLLRLRVFADRVVPLTEPSTGQSIGAVSAKNPFYLEALFDFPRIEIVVVILDLRWFGLLNRCGR